MKSKINTREFTYSAIFSALIAIGAFISIPIGPVPFTMQNFFIFMAGILLKPKYAATSVGIYVLLGLVGLPIFSGFKGGPQYIFSPTFGFLIAFIIGAFVISKLSFGQNNFLKILGALIVGEVIFYIIGIPYMSLILNKVMNVPTTFGAALSAGMIPFLIPDLAKAVIAALIAPKLYKGLNIK